MNYKNIIWDWNGTIVDDAWLFVQIMNKILKKNQLSLISLDDYKQNFCFPIQKYWRGLGFRFTTKSFNKLNANFIKQYQKAMFSPKIHRGMISFLKTIQNLALVEKRSKQILKEVTNQKPVNELAIQNGRLEILMIKIL